MPAPTLEDPKRTKRHKVIGITEEYGVQAQLDGQANIRIPAMSFLANYADGGPGLILLAVHANLPVRGRVQGKVPDVASVSTGYRMTVQLSAVAEVAARHTGNDVTFDPPEIRDLHVSISRLEFSNDLLEAGHRQVRRIVNHDWRTTRSVSAEAKTNRCKRQCPHARCGSRSWDFCTCCRFF